MSVPRAERLVDMTTYLLDNPHKPISLTFFSERYDSAKSSISEDIQIIKKTFQDKMGEIETTAGAAGGVKYLPYMNREQANEFADEVVKIANDPSRVLAGGYIFTSDILSQPDVLATFGRLIASQYVNENIEAVMTVATKGVPVAVAVARQLGVPYVIARSGTNKVTEGPTLSTPYTTGTAHTVNKMELSRRSLEENKNIIIVDDFMKAGGTINGMMALAEQFKANVKGVAVFADGLMGESEIDKFTSLIHVVSNLEDGSVINVTKGTFDKEIYGG